MAKPPTCLPGYTWLPSFGSSCFKITEMKGITFGTTTVNAEPTFNKICAQDGTRLASIKSSGEQTALLEWAFGTHVTIEKNVSLIIHINSILMKQYFHGRCY